MPDAANSTFETPRVERRGPVGWLVFDRPAAGNAMDARMMAGLERARRALDDDLDVASLERVSW